jgi:hypothetical protein
MAVRDFTVRISGQVAYTDGTKDSFEGSGVWRGHLGGQVATHNAAHSLASFQKLEASLPARITDVLALLPGTNTFNPEAPATAKDVASFYMEISGHVAHDDNTSGGFVVQWVDGTVDVFPSATDTHYAAILADTTARAFLDSVYEKVVGTGRVTLAQ